MSQVSHQRDTRCNIIWGNVEKPVIAGSPTTPDWDKTTSLTALTSQALPVEGFTFFNANPNYRRLNRQTGARHRTVADVFNDDKGAIPGVTLSMPATYETLDLFLALGLQRVSEDATTPFVKTYQYPVNSAAGFSSGRYPEFENNEGYFCGLVFSSKSSIIGAYEEVMMGCVPTEVRLTCQSDQHDGQLWIEADMIGRYLETSLSYTGTITDATAEVATRFHINDLAVRTFASTSAMPIYGFGFTISTGAKMVPFGGTGGGGSTDCVMAINTSGFVDFLANDDGAGAFDVLRTAARASVSSLTNLLAWGDGTVSTSGELNFAWEMSPRDPVPVGSDELRFRCDFDCVDITGNNAFNVVFANALDRGW